jgi:hypothetical protein
MLKNTEFISISGGISMGITILIKQKYVFSDKHYTFKDVNARHRQNEKIFENNIGAAVQSIDPITLNALF